MRGSLTGRTPTRRFPTPTQRDEQEARWDFLMVRGTCTGSHCQREERLPQSMPPGVYSAMHFLYWKGACLQLQDSGQGYRVSLMAFTGSEKLQSSRSVCTESGDIEPGGCCVRFSPGPTSHFPTPLDCASECIHVQSHIRATQGVGCGEQHVDSHWNCKHSYGVLSQLTGMSYHVYHPCPSPKVFSCPIPS